MLLDVKDLDRATHFFDKYGSITVLIGRLLPVVRTFIALPRRHRADAATSLSYLHLSWFVAMVLCAGLRGHEAGPAMGHESGLQGGVPSLPSGVEIVLLVGIVWFIWTHLISRKRAQVA